MRNCIYTFASTQLPGERCCVVPRLTLAQTCRQIRCEYRPICLKAQVIIDWKDVPAYLKTFFSTQNNKILNIDLAPKSITIFTNTYYHGNNKDAAKAGVAIDLLPILRMGLNNDKFKCNFMYEPSSAEATTLDLNKVAIMRADVTTLHKLLTHRHACWLQDVVKGRIRRLLISHIGTEDYPRARFFLGPGYDGTLPDEFPQDVKISDTPKSLDLHSYLAQSFTYPQMLDRYVMRIGLRDAFAGNEYVFHWKVERDLPARGSRFSFFLD